MHVSTASFLQKKPRTTMARKSLLCTLIVAVFAATLLGAQADTQDAMEGILKFAEKILNNILQNVQDAVHKAQEFIQGIKQKIRQEEDKLLSQVPDPLGKLLKDIVDKIHESEDKKAELRANMTKCVTTEAQPAFGIIRSTMEGVKSCIDEKTSDLKSTISDFEGLIKQALDLVISAPKDVMSCIKFPPTSETWSCVTTKVQDVSSKGLMLASSLIGDMGTIGKDASQVVKNVVDCGVDQRLEAEKKLGQIIEKIGACEKDAVNKST